MAVDIDVSNDPEIERLGANATAQFALSFWNRLCEAARKDGSLLDPLWENCEEEALGDVGADSLAHYTTQIVVTKDLQEDIRLYRRFRSNFGTLPVQHIRQSADVNPLGGPKWTSLLLASEGLVEDFNFISLLRADAHDVFWMTETEVCDGLLVVPRAQFVFIEVARIKEGVYNADFRRKLQLFDWKTQTEVLDTALSTDNEEASLLALQDLRTQWPHPRVKAFRQAGVLRVVRRGVQHGSTEVVRTSCRDLLHYWQDFMDLGRIAKNLVEDMSGRERIAGALNRAGRVFVGATSAGGNFNGGGAQKTSRKHKLPSTRTTSSFSDLVLRDIKDSHKSARAFRTYGMCVLDNLVPTDVLLACKRQANESLKELIEQQLAPRGLEVDGMNEFDYAEVRQRPGHRVDNRYKIMDDPTSPIATLGRSLLALLPRVLNRGADEGYKLLYGGVVHSFPRKSIDDSVPPAQLWHRDGPSLFSTAHHDTHCFNVFVPLVDVTTENGTTEFIPGTHDDDRFEELVADVFALAQKDPSAQHECAVRAEVTAGTVVVFDVRLLHRGLANASMQERPMMYFTFSRDWFVEQHMFQEMSIVEKAPDDAQRILTSRLYELVVGHDPMENGKGDSYGHPHYTTRFDLLLLEGLASTNSEEQVKANQNMAAILAFVSASDDEKHKMALELIESFGPKAHQRKEQSLRDARERRRQVRKQETAAYLDYSDWQETGEDFSSISTDMSDVATLYDLTAAILLEESTHLRRLGFSKDQDGICILLALVKAHCSSATSIPSCARLEEAFTSWWHAGLGRFAFQTGAVESVEERAGRHVLVVFSSLGSGIARPEWGGSLHKVVNANKDKLDVLQVLDPAFSWYCQDPTCQWKGGEYYESELEQRLKGYDRVMLLGDSMGAAAALRFSSLATHVLAFTPQVDISSYEAITRNDFSIETRRAFEQGLIETVRRTDAEITIHYGQDCEEDVRQIQLLDSKPNVKLVAHDFDDHILSLHLRDVGKLESIVHDAVLQFLNK